MLHIIVRGSIIHLMISLRAYPLLVRCIGMRTEFFTEITALPLYIHQVFENGMNTVCEFDGDVTIEKESKND